MLWFKRKALVSEKPGFNGAADHEKTQEDTEVMTSPIAAAWIAICILPFLI
jgi:hypothetical protein